MLGVSFLIRFFSMEYSRVLCVIVLLNCVCVEKFGFIWIGLLLLDRWVKVLKLVWVKERLWMIWFMVLFLVLEVDVFVFYW